jgi:toxin-antitoxin system PIN domain toxin
LKIADVQVLFYAIDPTSLLHAPAARWLEDAINARESLGLTWPTVHQFLRLGSNPAFAGHMSDPEALGWIEAWLDAGVQLISDADVHWELFAELVGGSRRALRNAIDDAHLAAVAISRGATLASFDRDFEAFVAHGLRWERLGA